MAEVSLPMENHEKKKNHQGMNMIEKKSADGSVAVDIGALSPETEHIKALQRNGGEKSENTANSGFREGKEKEVTFVHVAQDGGPSEVFRVTTPRAGGKSNNKRSGRRRSTWLGPRRVLFVFAALSSMGTLILLYFTLSLAKTTANQIDSQ